MPYLGGGAPRAHAWQRYHVRYYSMTLLFIPLEMEMMFMYPWAVVFLQAGMKAMTEMGMFLAILSLGILYGWRGGIFRSEEHRSEHQSLMRVSYAVLCLKKTTYAIARSEVHTSEH